MRSKQGTAKPARQATIALLVYTVLMLSVSAVTWLVYLYGPGNHPFEKRPIFGSGNRFHDLADYVGKTAHLYHASAVLGNGVPIFTYPAPAAFVYKALIYSFPGHAVATYLAFLAICSVGFAILAICACRGDRWLKLSAAAAIVITAAFGIPLWYAADLGNLEVVVWAFAGAGLCFLLRARYVTAAVLIGLAAAIKPFPVLLLLLLVRRRKYQPAALGVATAGVVMLAALTALGPNPWAAYQNLKPGAVLYMSQYIMTFRPPEELRFLHSLLDGMKSAALIVKVGDFHPHKALGVLDRLRAEPGGWPVIHTLVRVYPLVAVAGLGLLFAVFYNMPTLNQLTALAVAVTLFPLSASEYTLLNLYVPFGALVVFLTREVAVGKVTLRFRSMLAFAVIYALLFSPLTLLMIYAADAKLLLLIALLVVAARSPMPSSYFGDPADGTQLQQMGEAGSSRAGLLVS